MIGSDLYVGGQFRHIGNVQANNIARWDGHDWHALGTAAGNGVSLTVKSLLADGDSLFVGGQFDAAGGMAASNLAVWHPGSGQWSTLGDGVTGGEIPVVSAMVKNGADLYVAGRFTATTRILVNNIACWNGSSWSRLYSGIYGVVAALAVHGNRLYVGGRFSSAGDIPVHNLACWDMVLKEWSDVGGGVDSIVSAIAFHGSDVYVGGHFYNVGGSVPATQLAIWNEASRTWRPFSMPILNQPFNIAHVDALLIDGSNLYVGGAFNMGFDDGKSFQDTVRSIIRWNLDTDSLEVPGRTLVEYDTKYPTVEALHLADGMLYVAGTFPLAGYYEASNIAALRIADDRWISLGSGVNGMKARLFVNGHLAFRDRDGLRSVVTDGRSIYAAGYLSSAGGAPMRNVARWDGTAWKPLGAGLGRVPVNILDFGTPEHVDLLLLHGTELIAGGFFSASGSDPMRNVALWDGSRWLPMGSLSGDGFASVTALTFVGDDLYAAGQYSLNGSLTNAVARWDGSDWIPVSTGFDGAVYALAADGDDLYVGGAFKQVGDLVCNGVARLNPATGAWSALAGGVTLSGTPSTVHALFVDRGVLYAGGDFGEAGGVPAARVAMWDGRSWSPIGAGIGLGSDIYGGSVLTFAKVGNDLYIGGDFLPANGIIGSNLMMWDGENWREVDQGVDDRVNGLAVTGDSLLVCGDFHNAGETYAHYLTIWRKATGTAEVIVADAVTGASGVAITSLEPNPATDRLSIAVRLSHACFGTLAVYDMLGQRVATISEGSLQAGFQELNWSAADLPEGNYFLRLTTPEGICSARLVVRHR